MIEVKMRKEQYQVPQVEFVFRDNADTDPYEVSTPENVLQYVKSTVRETVTA